MNCFQRFIERIYLSVPNNLVYFDQITGIHNRNYYERVIKIKYNSHICDVVFIDINNLKFTNDTQGHSVGTKLICDVANLLTHINADELFRYGGDEFILIFKNSLTMDTISWLNDNACLFSWGMYSKEQFEDLSSAIRKADENMYSMKKEYHQKIAKISNKSLDKEPSK